VFACRVFCLLCATVCGAESSPMKWRIFTAVVSAFWSQNCSALVSDVVKAVFRGRGRGSESWERGDATAGPRQSPRGRRKADGDWGLENRNTRKQKVGPTRRNQRWLLWQWIMDTQIRLTECSYRHDGRGMGKTEAETSRPRHLVRDRGKIETACCRGRAETETGKTIDVKNVQIKI